QAGGAAQVVAQAGHAGGRHPDAIAAHPVRLRFFPIVVDQRYHVHGGAARELPHEVIRPHAIAAIGREGQPVREDQDLHTTLAARGSPRRRMTRAGTPAAIDHAGMARVTTAPPPITECCPTSAITTAPSPIQQPAPIRTSCSPRACSRITVVRSSIRWVEAPLGMCTPEATSTSRSIWT